MGLMQWKGTMGTMGRGHNTTGGGTRHGPLGSKVGGSAGDCNTASGLWQAGNGHGHAGGGYRQGRGPTRYIVWA